MLVVMYHYVVHATLGFIEPARPIIWLHNVINLHDNAIGIRVYYVCRTRNSEIPMSAVSMESAEEDTRDYPSGL